MTQNHGIGLADVGILRFAPRRKWRKMSAYPPPVPTFSVALSGMLAHHIGTRAHVPRFQILSSLFGYVTNPRQVTVCAETS